MRAHRHPHRLTTALAALGCAIALVACDADEAENPVQRPDAPEPGGTPMETGDGAGEGTTEPAVEG